MGSVEGSISEFRLQSTPNPKPLRCWVGVTHASAQVGPFVQPLLCGRIQADPSSPPMPCTSRKPSNAPIYRKPFILEPTPLRFPPTPRTLSPSCLPASEIRFDWGPRLLGNRM